MNNAQAQGMLQRADEFGEFGSADRVEARGRLVEENDIGIERERARQRHALDHAAGKLGRIFAAYVRAQAHHFELGERDLVHQSRREPLILAHRELHVLQSDQR
jgi:hypothetical protein